MLCPVCHIQTRSELDAAGNPVQYCRNPQCPRYRPVKPVKEEDTQTIAQP